MRYGFFDDDAREYVIERPDTPRSWSNTLGDTDYGAIITQHGGGYSFYRSAFVGRFLRLRFNATPMDMPGRLFYLRDAASGDFWSAAWQPVGKPLNDYQVVTRHGTGYTVVESRYAGIRAETTYLVPRSARYEVWHLRLRNESDRPRTLDVFPYAEFASNWSLIQDLINLQYSQYIVRADWNGPILSVRINENLPEDPERFTNNDQSRWAWMAIVGVNPTSTDATRDEFIGPYGTYAAPRALTEGACRNSVAYGDNACGAAQLRLELAPGEERTVTVLVGVGRAEVAAPAAIAAHGTTEQVEAAREDLRRYWGDRLAGVSVRTPDPQFDSMVNVWNPYNALITYAWSRTASLVYNGERDGLGFRDTVQDVLGVLPMIAKEAEAKLSLMLTGQLSHGGAMPVVKPFDHRPGEMPVTPDEELRSDDCLWFFNAVPAYVAETGDLDYYRKVLPFADAGEATVFGHLRRALEFNLNRRGRHGLPCGLDADWNDCLKLGYHGESLFVAFQLRLGLVEYAAAARWLELDAEADWADRQRADLEAAIDAIAWDEDRYLWAIGEDGTRYGTRASSEGSIYLNTQVWSIISGTATPERAERCMATLHEHLMTPYGAMLCHPAFRQVPVDVMRAVLFVPGTKENAGIFSHPQSWVVWAECLLGRGNEAYAAYRAFMPSAMNDRAEVREVEPYVHCQSTHGADSPFFGRSRLPWLSGTASWATHVATHWILGVRPHLDGLIVDPCLPSEWNGFEMTRRFRGRNVRIEVRNPRHVCRGVVRLQVDGAPVEGTLIPLELLREGARIEVELG